MTRLTILLVVCAALLGGCSTSKGGAYAASSAVCVLQGTLGNETVSGQIVFRQDGDQVMIEGEVSGLTPGPSPWRPSTAWSAGRFSPLRSAQH